MTTLCQGQKERYVCPSRKRCRLFLEWEKVPTIARSQVSSVLLWRQIGEETCAKYQKPTPEANSEAP